jgi:DNA-binding NarL/FixJ family response regulator
MLPRREPVSPTLPPALPISVAVADAHPITFEGMAQVLELAGFAVNARCRSGEACVQVLKAQRPDVVIVDLRLEGMDDLGLLREMKRSRLASRPILFAAVPEAAGILEAIRLGVRGVVLKEMAPHLAQDKGFV